ncbi:50S ribosomal protein L18 [Candidatus Woesebacteria bacterium]|nr:50S ribosomal protein L18 [Candidatus Woesebacteria bacterium]
MKNMYKKSSIYGTMSRPRVSISKSNKYLSAQLIDDERARTIISGSDKDVKISKNDKSKEIGDGNKVIRAYNLGIDLAKKAKSKKITSVVFDRGRYRYHGRVRALAEGLRKGGIKL